MTNYQRRGRGKERNVRDDERNEENAGDEVSINIGNINEGAAIDAFNLELRKVLENIADLSTVATATRTITLKVEFKPESDRCKVQTEFSTKTTLAPIEKHCSKIFVARTENGHLVALDADPRQMALWSPPKPKEVPVVQFGRV